jgi:hypothetical protein
MADDDLDEAIKRQRVAAALSAIDVADTPPTDDTDAAALSAAQAETDRQLADAKAASKSDTPDVSTTVQDTYGDWKKWPSLSEKEVQSLFDTTTAQSVGAPSPEPDIKPQPTVFDTETKQAVGAPSPEPIVSPPTPIETPPPSMAPGLGTVGGAPETKALEPVTAESVQAAPEERPASRPGAAVPSPLPSPPDIPAGHIDLEPIVRRAELVKLPGERVYPTVAEDQGAPGTAVAVRKAEPVVPSPIGPKAPGAHTELAAPGQMDLREDTDVPTARAVPATQPTAPTEAAAKPAAKPIYNDPSTWLTPDGTSVGGTVTQTDTTLPPPMNAPNGKAPVALIIHHTSGRNSAESVVDDWRTHRPGVGAQMIMDRDGTIHETQKEFGYNGTGNFLHSVVPGVSNQTAVGIEVIAKDDADMTPAQLQSLQRLAGPKGPYANVPVYGHSQVSPGDRDNEGVRGVAAIIAARKGAGGDSGDTLQQLSSSGLNVTHFGYKGDADLDSESAAGHGKYVENMMPGYDVALNAAAAKLVGNPLPGSEFQYAGRTWRYGDQVPEKYKDARFDIFDKNDTVFSGGQLGSPSQIAEAGPKKQAWESWATLTPEQESAATQQGREQQQKILTDVQNKAVNMPAFMSALQNPISGVSDEVRNAVREEYKKQIIAYAQEYYKESDPQKAFDRIMAVPNLGTFGGEILTKLGPNFQHAWLSIAQQADSPTQTKLIDFINAVHPEATPEARTALIKQVMSDTGRARVDLVNALYNHALAENPDSVKNINLYSLLDAIDVSAQPGMQAKEEANHAKVAAAVAQNRKDLREDPTLENTYGGTIANAIASLPKNTAEALVPVIGQSAMFSEIYTDTLDGLRKDHPDWSEDTLKAKAAAASLPQDILQELVNAATLGVGGGVTRGITNPLARIAASAILHGTVAAGAGTAQQALANVSTGRPAGEGVPQAGLAAGIQGLIGGAVSGRHPAEAERIQRIAAQDAARTASLEVGEHGPETPMEVGPHGPPRPPLTQGNVLGPDVPDTSMPWYKPGPVVTRGVERTTFTPAELVEGAGRLTGRTPEELQAAAEQMRPSTDFTQRNVFLDSSEAQQAEIDKAREAQAPQSPLTLAEAIQQQGQDAAAASLGGTPGVMTQARVSEADPYVSRIANKYTAERMASGELGQIDPSQGKSTEEMVHQGLQMSPEQRDGLIDNFTKGKGGDLDQQGAAIRSKESILSVQSRDASRAAAADPTNLELAAQAKAALDAVTAFHNGPIKKFKKVWSDAGRGLQREIPLDYTTFNGMKEAYLKAKGNEAPPELEPKLKQTADAVSKAANAERAAMNNLGKEIEARTRGNPLSDEHVRARLMEIMKDLPCRT